VKIFETEAALAQANLQAGQLVRTKGYENADDGISTLWRIAASGQGQGVTLANGNVAVPYSDTSARIRKNYIINGDMATWQRGTNFEDAASETYTADRWYIPSKRSVKRANGDFPPNQGFINSLRAYITGNTSAENAQIQTWLETGGTGKCGPYIKGKTMTFSGWIKADVGRNISGLIRFSDGRGNSNTINVLPTKVIHTGTGGWVKFKETFTIDVDPNSTNIALNIGMFSDIDGVATEFLVTGLQLEDGPIDTAFEFLQQQERIALCQRYYQRRTTGENGINLLSTAYRDPVSYRVINFQFPVRMRAAPTVSDVIDNTGWISISYRTSVDGCRATGSSTSISSSASISQIAFDAEF